MKKYILTLFSFLFLYHIATPTYSQQLTDANLVGHVINSKTGEHVPFISITIKGTTLGTASDASGHYFFKNLPLGKATVRFQAIGYIPIEREVEITKGVQELNVEISEDAVMLNETVVSSNRNETKRKETPTIVNIINPKLFEATNSINLSQGLSFQPGLRVENNCQNCGFQQVRINGLEGPYSQILIDSKPIFSSLAGVYGLEQIPTNMIERVEVVRGGGSAIFGSNAIAGTINIITKEPLYNTFQISNNLMLLDGDTPDNTTSMNAALVTNDNKAGMHIFGMVRNRKPFDVDGDGFSELPKIQGNTLGFRSYYKTSLYSKLTLEYHYINEFRRGGNKFDLPPHETDITEQAEHKINGGGLGYTLFTKNYKHKISLYTSAQNVDRKSYYGTQQNPDAYGQTTNTTLVGGAQYTYNADNLWFMPAEFTAGSEYVHDDLNDKILGYNRDIKQVIKNGSFYLQNEWKTPIASILLGGRVDKHNLVNNLIISPRANVRYNPLPDLSLRASFSTGFRAPQTFDEDLHISAVGGEVALIQVSPNLKPEYSNSFSASADYFKNFGSIQINFLIEGFYTKLNNVFITPPIGEDSRDNIIFERQNGSGAIVKGLNLECKLIIPRIVTLQTGGTVQNSKYDEPFEWSTSSTIKPVKQMLRTPDYYGYFTATSQFSKSFGFAASGTYTGSMYVPHFAGYIPEDRLKKTPHFFDLNLKVTYDFKISSDVSGQLCGGVQNIFNSYQKDFDRGVMRDSGYIYGPVLPRSIFLGLKFGIF